jgi:hypothetical protein
MVPLKKSIPWFVNAFLHTMFDRYIATGWSPVLIMGDGSTRAFFEASIKVELARQWNWQGCSVLGRLLAERSCNSGASGSEKVALKEMGLYKK